MSSIGSATSTDYASQYLDYLGDGQYRVSDQDPSAGAEGAKVVSETQVNQMLAAYGLKMAGGQLVSTDGFSMAGTSALAATSYGGAPVLPDLGGPFATAASVGGSLGALSGDISDAALMWVALSTMATTAMREVKDAKDLKIAQQQAKIDGKQAEIKATKERIQAEKDAALVNFITSVVVAVVVAAATAFGGPAGAAVGQAVGGAFNAYSQYASKMVGPQAVADQKQIEEKIWQKQQEIAQQSVEEAGSSYDEAKELFKLAIKILTEHAERQTQVVESIARTS